jgi:signal transduction histidine kinase
MQSVWKMKAPRRTALSENQRTRVETALGLRAAVAGFGHTAVYIAFRQFTPFPRGIPDPVNWGGGLILFILLARWGLVYLQKTRYPDPTWRRRWRVLFRTVSITLALSWSLVTVSTLLTYGVTFTFFVPALIILGTASIAVQAFGLDLLFTQIFLFLILGPTILTSFFIREPSHVALGMILSAALGYLVFLANSSFRLLYEALENRELIQAQRDQLTAVLDAIPGYVFWTDSEGNYLGMNRKLTEIVPIAAPLRDAPLTQEITAFLRSPGSECLVETTFQFEGGLRNGLVAMKKYQSASGMQAVFIVLDIEDRKKAQEELEKTRARAFESARLAALGVMAGGIAHEINNPLQVIRALSELLKRQSVDIPQAAAKIEATTDRVARIIAGLRSFARVGQNYPIETVEIASLVAEVVNLARVSQVRYRVPIEVDPIPSNLAIEGRRTELGQVLINLINNALDATANTPNPWIKIQARDAGAHVEILIEDSGDGIPESLSEKIMLPFFTTKEIGKGTGLGLSISKSIAEGHQGSLRLDRESKHTLFVLTLPKQQKAQPLHA